MVGNEHPWDEALATVADTTVRLRRNDELIFEAPAGGSLGGPAAAREWMLARAERLGWPLAEETVLLTGTVGQAVPFAPGEYRADYGALGSVAFSIR